MPGRTNWTRMTQLGWRVRFKYVSLPLPLHVVLSIACISPPCPLTEPLQGDAVRSAAATMWSYRLRVRPAPPDRQRCSTYGAMPLLQAAALLCTSTRGEPTDSSPSEIPVSTPTAGERLREARRYTAGYGVGLLPEVF